MNEWILMTTRQTDGEMDYFRFFFIILFILIYLFIYFMLFRNLHLRLCVCTSASKKANPVFAGLPWPHILHIHLMKNVMLPVCFVNWLISHVIFIYYIIIFSFFFFFFCIAIKYSHGGTCRALLSVWEGALKWKRVFILLILVQAWLARPRGFFSIRLLLNSGMRG